MSKRSSRRKRKERRQKQEAKLTGPVLIERGLKAFHQANYDEAITDWEHARRKGNAPANLPAALAEAYFRRAMSSLAPNLTDLQQAVNLRPADACYRYHLALTYHRLGKLDQAESIYRDLLALSPPFERAAMPLAQLLIEKKKSLAKDPVWDHLGAEAKTPLVAAEAIVRKKATSTLQRLAETPLDPLWRGLAALALDDRTTARENLQTALETDQLHALPLSVVRYYLGVLTAADDQLNETFEQWQVARANGLDTQPLRRNLGILTYRQLLAERQAGRPAQALDLLEQIHQPGSIGIDPSALRRQLTWELGYAAAQQNDWARALEAWQTVEEMGDDSRKLLFNLALAYQKTEHYWEAAERWRDLLRRRPRKADHPEALSDEQVTRIWQNVADNYGLAGDYEEAVKTYKTAVKYSPDNLELRLKLVDALQAEGRWQAAENELNRILDKNPDHIPALIALAESYADDYWGQHQARQLLLRVLELEPQNPIARQQLAFLFERQAMSILQWGQTTKALAILKEGLELVPDNQRLLVLIGGVHVELDEYDKGRQYFEKAWAVNPDDLQTLYTIYLSWLRVESKPDLDEMFERIKAVTLPIPGSFFLDLIERCLETGQDKWADELIEYAEAQYQDDEPTLLALASLYRELEQEGRAVAILRKMLKNNPDHAEANMRLGTLYFEMGQTRLAKRHWQKAEQQARKENDQMLLYQLQTTRDMMLYGKLPPQNMFELLRQMPPELKAQLFEQAPPEIAGILKNMSPEMIEAMMELAMEDDELGPFGFFDDEDDYYV